MSIRHSNYRRVVKRPATTVDERPHSLNSILPARAANHSQNKPDESRTADRLLRKTSYWSTLVSASKPIQRVRGLF